MITEPRLQDTTLTASERNDIISCNTKTAKKDDLHSITCQLLHIHTIHLYSSCTPIAKRLPNHNVLVMTTLN